MAGSKKTVAVKTSVINERALLEERLNERFAEIAELTRLLAQSERERQRLADHVNWLHEIVPHLRKRFRISFLNRWQDTTLLDTLKRRNLFDARAYLAANPDVERAGIDPLHHYLEHGLHEGRSRG